MRLTTSLLALLPLFSTALSACVDYQVFQYIADLPDKPGIALSVYLNIDGVVCSKDIPRDAASPGAWWDITCEKTDHGAALSTDLKQLQWIRLKENLDYVPTIDLNWGCADVGLIPIFCDARGRVDC
ncbi:hypothetical protein AJ80_04779 [Polytolypa hystricis UAMH7299]|uniref:Cyanovirin-N domain-containing protein n=1 Tax=Polytolypa hystricis (strain UAMH7299) TaxID=1447883 RepID=A0A2B7Y8R7_POLH7|nr:hypothetical protein AJ80_04779 [Polytolypa hystricis UAMH7299]